MLKACQIPFKLGLPSSVRETPAEEGVSPAVGGACPAIGIAVRRASPRPQSPSPRVSTESALDTFTFLGTNAMIDATCCNTRGH